jgi:hypothetical protein
MMAMMVMALQPISGTLRSVFGTLRSIGIGALLHYDTLWREEKKGSIGCVSSC